VAIHLAASHHASSERRCCCLPSRVYRLIHLWRLSTLEPSLTNGHKNPRKRRRAFLRVSALPCIYVHASKTVTCCHIVVVHALETSITDGSTDKRSLPFNLICSTGANCKLRRLLRLPAVDLSCTRQSGNVPRYCDISQAVYEATHTSEITLVVEEENDVLHLEIKLIRKQIYRSCKPEEDEHIIL